LNQNTNLEDLLSIGASLSSEKDTTKLIEEILQSAMRFTNADAGSLYLVSDSQHLKFEIVINKSRRLHIGGKSKQAIDPIFNPHNIEETGLIDTSIIPLYLANGEPNLSRAVCNAVHLAKTINIPDIYSTTDFDFSGTKLIDQKNKYCSKSFLMVPMMNSNSEVLGVLQLINAIDPETSEIIPFSRDSERIVEALTSQATIAMTNRLLIDHLESLFVSLINLINQAIDDKSPYTAGHCNRVPDLTLMLADAVNRCKIGPLSAFNISAADRYELKIAGLLHDCGKITTPVHIVDKATKLEKIFDRVELIELRYEMMIREIALSTLNGEISEEDAQKMRAQLVDDSEFLYQCNTGVESMKDADIDRVHQIASSYSWVDQSGQTRPYLSEDEVHNLTIRSGTLTADERQIINRHIESTINMLEQLPWPAHLKKVPEYAGGHHERMDGKGYPKGLTREQMSIQARCMGIADIFEALTAKDRPYKKGKTLSESLHILGKMKLNGHIDPDLFDIFVWEKVYEEYAQKFLDDQQIDPVDVTQIPGYQAPSPNYRIS
jgi:HD-GYP domain-containing protein (c-di-GMP phosphodiesterase class II)